MNPRYVMLGGSGRASSFTTYTSMMPVAITSASTEITLRPLPRVKTIPAAIVALA